MILFEVERRELTYSPCQPLLFVISLQRSIGCHFHVTHLTIFLIVWTF